MLWQQVKVNHFLSVLFQSIFFSSLIMVVDSGNPTSIILKAPDLCSSCCTQVMAQDCSVWAQPLPPISSVLRLLLPVLFPLHLTRYLRILTEIFSDCGSGGLAREFGFIHHDAPPVEKEASYLSLQGRWFRPLSKGRNRLEPQSRTNCTLAGAWLL